MILATGKDRSLSFDVFAEQSKSLVLRTGKDVKLQKHARWVLVLESYDD